MPWGGGTPPSRTLPWRKGQGCAFPPLPCPYIYVGGGRAAIQMFWCSPPLLPSPSPLPWCLAKPCRIVTLLHHHHAVVLLLDGVFLNLSLLLAGSRRGRRHRAVRVLNAEVLSVRHLVIGDLDHDEYDSINPVHLNASAYRSTRVCRCTPSLSLLDDSID